MDLAKTWLRLTAAAAEHPWRLAPAGFTLIVVLEVAMDVLRHRPLRLDRAILSGLLWTLLWLLFSYRRLSFLLIAGVGLVVGGLLLILALASNMDVFGVAVVSITIGTLALWRYAAWSRAVVTGRPGRSLS